MTADKRHDSATDLHLVVMTEALKGIHASLDNIRTDIRELRQEVKEIRKDFSEEIKGVREEIKDVRRDMSQQFYFTLAAFVGILGLLAKAFGWL